MRTDANLAPGAATCARNQPRMSSTVVNHKPKEGEPQVSRQPAHAYTNTKQHSRAHRTSNMQLAGACGLVHTFTYRNTRKLHRVYLRWSG